MLATFKLTKLACDSKWHIYWTKYNTKKF